MRARSALCPGERGRQVPGYRGPSSAGPCGAETARATSLRVQKHGVDAARCAETVEGCAVEVQAPGLNDGIAVEAEAEPREVGEQCVGERGPGARGIEVLDPEEELPALGAGPQPAEHRRPGIAEVEPPRGTGGEPAAMGRRHVVVRAATAPL